MMLARVVGAGLSGLTAAWRLTEAGFTVEVIEAAERPGGLIETIGTPHGRVEGGANAFVWSQSVATLFASLDITPQFASALPRGGTSSATAAAPVAARSWRNGLDRVAGRCRRGGEPVRASRARNRRRVG